MAGIRAEQLRVDQYLTNFSISAGQAMQGFVADEVAPRLNVPVRSGKYMEWNEAEDYRVHETAYRRPGGASTEIDIDKSDQTYSAEGYALHVVIPDQEQQDSPQINLLAAKTRRLTRKIKAARELRVSALTKAANFPATQVKDLSAGSNVKWSVSTADPLADIEAGMEAVYKEIGVVPNRLLIPLLIALRLRNHPNFVSRFKEFTDTVRDISLPPTIFGLRPIIPRAQYNTAARQATKTLTLDRIWGNRVVLYYVEDDQTETVDNETITSFKSFWVQNQSGVYRWYEPSRRSQIVEEEEVIVEKTTASKTVYVIDNVI